MRLEDKRFSETLVADVFDSIVKVPVKVSKEAKIKEVIEGMLSNPISRKVYVVGDDDKLLGVINTETILRLIGYRTGIRELGALSFYRFMRDMFKEDISELVTQTRSVTTKDELTKALNIMIQDHINDLPVVDENGQLIGELVSLELFLKGKDLFNNEMEDRT